MARRFFGTESGKAPPVSKKDTDADMQAAWAIGERFADQTFSIVDRTSFVVMERLGLTRVASFDRDFAIYRYGRDRNRAFEVMR
jgi:uncharacterized protein